MTWHIREGPLEKREERVSLVFGRDSGRFLHSKGNEGIRTGLSWERNNHKSKPVLKKAKRVNSGKEEKRPSPL